MAQILVRNLEPHFVQRLKRQAKRSGRSLQAEVKIILEQGLKLDPEEALRLADSIRSRFKGRVFTDSLDIIRQGRQR